MTYLGMPPTLAKCREHLKAQSEPFDEVIEVRGDGKTSESRDISEGFLRSKADYIFTTNADCYVPPHFNRTLSRWLDRGYCMASGVRRQTDPIGRAFNAPLPEGPRFAMSTGLGVSGGCMAFNRHVLGPLLPFKYSVGWDLEMAMRCRGRFVIDPSVVTIHDHPITSRADLFRKSRAYARRAIIMARDFGSHRIERHVPVTEGRPLDNLVFLLGQVGGLV
jgi:hypothetical protein